MGLAQGNFDRATVSGAKTLITLLQTEVNLDRVSKREIITMLHDLEQIGAALRIELMNRPGV